MSIVANNETLLIKCLRALSDELCLKMLRALVNGPATAVELAERFHCKQLAARRRLEKLCRAGLAQCQRQRKRGKEDHALYTACIEKVKALFSEAMSYTGIAQEPGQNGEAPGSSL